MTCDPKPYLAVRGLDPKSVIECAVCSTKFVAEEGVAMRDIAEAIGRSLKVPAKSISMEEAPAHFGWLAMFADHDLLASSEKTRKKLGWNPTGPGLIADLERLGLPEG